MKNGSSVSAFLCMGCLCAGLLPLSATTALAGAYIGEYASYQTRCNSGYMVDPANPTHFYIPTMGEVLTRFVFDYARGTWKTDAVFPNVSCGMRSDLNKAVCVRTNGNRLYFASEHNGWVYRMTDDGRRIVRSALGLYPVCPASGEYALGSPLFEKAAISFPSGKKLDILAPGVSSKCRYVRRVAHDGKAVRGNFVKFADLRSGGELTFEMCAAGN